MTDKIKIDMTDIVILIYIIRFNVSGLTNVSIKVLSELCHMSRISVNKRMHKLVDNGYINHVHGKQYQVTRAGIDKVLESRSLITSFKNVIDEIYDAVQDAKKNGQ